jgi:cell division control protein 12
LETKRKSLIMSNGIGIANLPNQKHRRAAKQGVQFTILVVGESGLGKTTFINTLFITSLLDHRDYAKRHKSEKTDTVTKLKVNEAVLEEKGFKMKLAIIEAPGFGDYVNNSDCWVPIAEFIDNQYLNYLNQEMQADRKALEDTRVHVCLYFIEPTGHALKTLDIVTMKELGSRVNLIPVIAKADTLAPEELVAFKNRIREEIAHHEIQTYSCPLESEDEETAAKNKEIQAAMPFAIIGSEDFYGTGDKKVRGRQYLWGVAEVENDQHCDFKKLRSLLLRSHLLDIRTKMEEVHYERFRDQRLEKEGLTAGMTPEQLKKDMETKMKNKEDQLKTRYVEIKKSHDERFTLMEEKLKNDQNRFNADLDQKSQELNSLKEEIKNLNAQLATKKKA